MNGGPVERYRSSVPPFIRSTAPPLVRGHRLQQTVAERFESGSFFFGDPIAAGGLQRDTRIALLAVHENFEMQVRSRAHARRTDVRHRLADGHGRSDADARREGSQVAVPSDVPVAMPNLQHVAVAAAPATTCDDAIGDCAHRSASVGRVVRAFVLANLTQDRMPAGPEDARDPAELQRSTQE